MNNNPIGILDSGVGGLTIWKEIVSQLPDESTIYIGDSKNCPYGNRDVQEIAFLASRMVAFLIAKNCKLIVVGCNTITVSSLDKLRSEFRNIPIVGTVPVVKTASERSRSKRIGIFSTQTTSNSQYQRDLINTFARECEVESIGTDNIVPFVESGRCKDPQLYRILQEDLEPFKNAGIDVLALGCSHFPLVKNLIQKIMGPSVLILDSGAAIGRQVKRVLTANDALSTDINSNNAFYTTGDTQKFSEILRMIGYNNSTEQIEL